MHSQDSQSGLSPDRYLVIDYVFGGEKIPEGAIPVDRIKRLAEIYNHGSDSGHKVLLNFFLDAFHKDHIRFKFDRITTLDHMARYALVAEVDVAALVEYKLRFGTNLPNLLDSND